ncbi:MAG: hypothetical protein AAF266_12670 [Planctomycetota bacterium]
MPAESRDAERRAIRLLERGRLRAALAVTTVGLCRDVNAARLWLLRAAIHHGQQDWSKALGDIEHAMTFVPLPPSGQLVLADCYWFTGRHDLALLAYEHSLNAVDQEPEFYAGVYAGLLRCERRDLALQCCRVAVESNPDDHAALFAMAHCMVALAYDATYVASVLERAVGTAPDRDVYRISLTLQLTRCGRAEEAYEQLAEASVAPLAEMTCGCSVGCLLRLCVWARDATRAGVLKTRLHELRRGQAKPDGA